MLIQFYGKRNAGTFGFGLSIFFFLLSSWRLFFHTLSPRPGQETEPNHPRINTETELSQGFQQRVSKWLTRKRIFHFLIWFATMCQTLAYAIISGVLRLNFNKSFNEKLSYVLLDVAGRSILEILATSVCTQMWVYTSIESGPGVLWGVSRVPVGFLPHLFMTFVVILVSFSSSLSVVTFALREHEDLEEILKSRWMVLQTIIEAATWGLQFVVVLQCLIITAKRVMVLVPSSERRQRLALLSKAVGPMLVSSAMYLLRCLWLVAIFCGVHKLERGSWLWWIGFVWLPTTAVLIMLLYSARKRDQVASSEELRQPLLPPRPPMEAFLAFSQHRQGLNVEDSFSFCRSPITHVLAPGDSEDVGDVETHSVDGESEDEVTV